MRFELSEELRQLQSMTREIVDNECIPLESEYLRDLTKDMTPEHHQHLAKISKEAGIFDAHVPSELGGGGLGVLSNLIISEQVNRSIVELPTSEVPVILYECNEAQRPYFLDPVVRGEKIVAFGQTEPQSGSDPGGMMQTRAIKRDAQWVVTGRKFFNTWMLVADFVMLQAVTDPQKRQRGGITMFLVDTKTPGISITPILTWVHQTKKLTPCEVVYDDVKVEDWRILGGVGNGFRLGQKWLTINDRLLRAGLSLGHMQRSFDMAVSWARNRYSFGKPIGARQAIQWMVVDMYVWIEALRALAYQGAWKVDNGYEEESRYIGALVKLCAGQWGHRCVDTAMQVMGGIAETYDLPIARFYTVMRHARIGGGTDEIQRIILSRWLIGREVTDL